MEFFQGYLDTIENQEHRNRVQTVLLWVGERFPDLSPRLAWNQPMFTHHGTYIIGFSTAKNHMAVAPERAGILRFCGEMAEAGYEYSNQLMRIKWSEPVDYSLLERMIRFNIEDKADCGAFWRK